MSSRLESEEADHPEMLTKQRPKGPTKLAFPSQRTNGEAVEQPRKLIIIAGKPCITGKEKKICGPTFTTAR